MAGKAHVKRKAGRKATKKKAKDVKKKVLGAGSSVGGGGAEAAVSGLKGMSGEQTGFLACSWFFLVLFLM
jgi:catalase (peroxidase I)